MYRVSCFKPLIVYYVYYWDVLPDYAQPNSHCGLFRQRKRNRVVMILRGIRENLRCWLNL